MENPTEIKVKPGQLENVICEKCKSHFFNYVIVLKKIPALISPNGKDTMQPIQLYRCEDCGHINKEMIPDGVFSKDKIENGSC